MSDENLEADIDYYFKGIDEVVETVHRVLDGNDFRGGNKKVWGICERIIALRDRAKIVPDIDDATVEEMRVAYEESQSRQDNTMASADGIRAALAVLRKKMGEI